MVSARYMRLSDPRRLELRTVSHDQQHTNGSYPVHRSMSASRLVGSTQCTSSKIISTGLCCASALICVDKCF